MPLISDMDEIEKKARRGDEEALKSFITTLRPITQHAIRRFMERDGLSLEDAVKKAGVIICIR